MTKFTTLLFLSLFFFSCNSEKSESTEKSASSTKECFYSIDNNLKLEWTAFKTTEKLAVKGSFDEVNFSNDSKENSLSNTIINSKFEIKPNTINSGNVIRDTKLKEIFFENFDFAETISGYIEECEGDNESGMAIANISMNNVSNQVHMKYKVNNEALELTGSFDLLDWKTEEAINALHKACFDLHKGKDGVSKTWSTMEISIIAPLQKDCK